MTSLNALPFEPLGANTPGAATGFTEAGIDIAMKYAPASAGVASGITTGFSAAGVDLGQLFAAVGSTQRLSNSWAGTYTDSAAGQATVTAKAFLKFKPDGTFEHNYGVGRWLAPNIDPTLYEIIATVTTGALTANLMVAWSQVNTERRIELLVSAGPSSSFAQQTAKVTVQIRKILDTAELVSGVVDFLANAESYGSTPPP